MDPLDYYLRHKEMNKSREEIEDRILEIQTQIDELEKQAEEIEKKMVELIEKADIIQKQGILRPSAYDDEPETFLSSSFKTRGIEQEKLQRALIRQYNQWFTQANLIICRYHPDEKDPFFYRKTGLTDYDGINPTIEFSISYLGVVDKSEIIRQLLRNFDCQRDVLIGIQRAAAAIIDDTSVGEKEKLFVKPAQPTQTIVQGDLNINSPKTTTTTVTTDTLIIQNFDNLKRIIQESEADNDQKIKLLSQVDQMQQTKGTSDFIEFYKEYTQNLANLATIGTGIYAASSFLAQLLPS